MSANERASDTARRPPAAADYDRFVDWEKRLAREGPFFRDLFERHAVRSVVDVGCGTGQHAILFASWGLHTVGVDPSDEMLAAARANASAAGPDASFVAAGFGDLEGLGLGPADAVTCTGNALPHVDGVAGLRTALADMAAILRPGGVLVLHLLNHQRLIDGRTRTIAPVVREDAEGTWVFLRVMDHVEDGIRFDFVTLYRQRDAWETGGGWQASSRRSLHTALPVSLLVPEVERAGLREVRLYGDHSGKTFDPAQDESVILLAVH